jgi:hypothetical protein
MSQIKRSVPQRHNTRCGKIIAMTVVYALSSEAAQAETLGSIELSSSVSYDSNPFLFVGKDTETASFRLEMIPRVSFSDGISEVRLTAAAEHVEYAHRYKPAQNLRVDVAAKSRLSSQLTISVQAAMASTIAATDLGRLADISDSSAPTATTTAELPLVPDDDFTVLGIRQRRNSYRFGASANYRISDRDEFRWSSNANLLRNGGQNGLNDYNYVSTQLVYSRALDSNFWIGAAIEAAESDFRYIFFGDASIISAGLSARLRFNERLELSGTAGATFTSVRVPTGRAKSTAFSGLANLCYSGELSSYCLNGLRQVLPTSFGGVRKRSSIGASYSLRASQYDTFRATASYSNASEPLLGTFRALSYLSAQGRYERRFDQRLFGFVSAGYADNFEDGVPRKASIRAMLGITYRFGSPRQ